MKINNLSDEVLFNIAYKAYNDDAGKEYPDNEIRQSLMEDLKPVFILYARRIQEALDLLES